MNDADVAAAAKDLAERAERGTAALLRDAQSCEDAYEKARLESKAAAVADSPSLLGKYLAALPPAAGWKAFGNALESLAETGYRPDGSRADGGYRQGLAVVRDWLRSYAQHEPTTIA